MQLTPLSFPPSTQKTYKRFTAKPSHAGDTAAQRPLEFFYIGRQSQKIDLLLHAFSSGYAADAADSAKSVLQRNANQNHIPDIIFVDGTLGESAWKELDAFFAASPRFILVPIVLDGADLPEATVNRCRKLRFLDDIIPLDHHTIQTVNAKALLLRKMKKIAAESRHAKEHRPWYITGKQYRAFSKRLFDILVATGLLLIVSPVFLIIAAAIKLESRGPVFYVAKRAGRGYRIFDFFKFRTMVQGADREIDRLSGFNRYNHANGDTGSVFFKMHNDKRITRVGALLRRTSIDELPQLVNVILGDMSLVGNRPLPLYEAARLTTDQWAARFLAPAGITGLWQINKRKMPGISIEDRINLDIAYSKEYGFFYDLWIIARTPLALIQRSNA